VGKKITIFSFVSCSIVHRRISLIIITSFQELINLIWRHAGIVAFSLCRKTRSIATFPKTTPTRTYFLCMLGNGDGSRMQVEDDWASYHQIHPCLCLFVEDEKKIVTIIPLHAKRSPWSIIYIWNGVEFTHIAQYLQDCWEKTVIAAIVQPCASCTSPCRNANRCLSSPVTEVCKQNIE